MSGKLRTWLLLYLGTLAVILLVAKYPYLLRGEVPAFFEGEILKTLVLAAVGTALLLFALRDARRLFSKKRPKL